jgi:integrase
MAGKKGNEEGTIRKRGDGRWEARIPVNGSKRKSLYAKTRQAAARRLTDARHDLDRGLPLLDERQTVGQYLEVWIQTVKPQIRPSTWRRYSDFVRVHLIPALGRIALAKLTPQHLQALYASKLMSGLSSTTVRHIHATLHRALKDALLMGLVQRNVTELVRGPRRASAQMLTLTEEQAKRFLEVTRSDRFGALYVLALTTGMREGELLGLRWRDIDFDHQRLQVLMNIQETPKEYVHGETKTASSRRSIALTPHCSRCAAPASSKARRRMSGARPYLEECVGPGVSKQIWWPYDSP